MTAKKKVTKKKRKTTAEKSKEVAKQVVKESKPAKKTGRPTKYLKSMDSIAEEFIAFGHSKTALCAELDITEDTLYRWIKENQPFSEAIKRGVARGLRSYEKRLLGLASGINSDKLKNVDKTALLFLLKTRFHKEWGNKEKLELSGKVEVESAFTTEQKVRMAQEFIKASKDEE